MRQSESLVSACIGGFLANCFAIAALACQKLLLAGCILRGQTLRKCTVGAPVRSSKLAKSCCHHMHLAVLNYLYNKRLLRKAQFLAKHAPRDPRLGPALPPPVPRSAARKSTLDNQFHACLQQCSLWLCVTIRLQDPANRTAGMYEYGPEVRPSHDQRSKPHTPTWHAKATACSGKPRTQTPVYKRRLPATLST